MTTRLHHQKDAQKTATAQQTAIVKEKTADWAHRELTEFSLDLPKTALRLLLNDNKITRVPALGLFNRLPQLESVDLSRNRIEVIEEGAFEGANSILEM